MDTPLNHSEYEQLAAGWALGALEPDDEVTFQRHLAACEACAASVRELEGVVGDLAYAAPPVDPPAGLWSSIERGIAPSARPSRATAAGPPRPQRARPRWGRPRRSPWPLRLAAAACVALLVALSFWNISLRDQNDVYRSRVATLEQIARLVNDPTTRTIALRGPAAEQGAQVTVLASSRSDRGVLLAEGLPPAARGQVYELWGVPQGDVARAQKAALFVAGGPDRPVLFEVPVQPNTAFAVTREPGPHGSEKPTSQPILIGSPS